MAIYGKHFAEVYNEKWAFFGPRMWPFLAKIVARRRPDAHTWLDLCCGTGSLLKLACRHGFEAVGLDLSRHQLGHARKNAPRAGLVRADVRDFSLGRTFDVVTCLFDSLNYLLTKRDLARAFRNARRHLAEGGLFAFDMNTFEGLRVFWHNTLVIRSARHTIINATSFDERRGLGHCRITGFIKEGRLYRRFEEDHIQRGYTADEIEGLLTRAGLAFTKYDGNRLARPSERSARLLYVCRRARADEGD